MFCIENSSPISPRVKNYLCAMENVCSLNIQFSSTTTFNNDNARFFSRFLQSRLTFATQGSLDHAKHYHWEIPDRAKWRSCEKLIRIFAGAMDKPATERWTVERAASNRSSLIQSLFMRRSSVLRFRHFLGHINWRDQGSVFLLSSHTSASPSRWLSATCMQPGSDPVWSVDIKYHFLHTPS